MNQNNSKTSQIVKFIRDLYMDACRKSFHPNYDSKKHRKDIVKVLDKKIQDIKLSHKNIQKTKKITKNNKNKQVNQSKSRIKNKKFGQTNDIQAFSAIKQFVQYNRQDFIQDLLQVANDMKTVIQQKKANKQKFNKRLNMHFGDGYYKYLTNIIDQKSYKDSASVSKTKNIIEWYKNFKELSQSQNNKPQQIDYSNFIDNVIHNQMINQQDKSRNQKLFNWSKQRQAYFMSEVYPSCTYLMGLTKGNGVIIEGKFLFSCAHVFIQQQTSQVMKIRCFSTPEGGFGVAYTQEAGVFSNYDVGFSQIIAYQGPNLSQLVNLNLSEELIKSALNFQKFIPVPCIQVGVLFIPDQQLLQTFQTTQGFIERNQYKNLKDINLSQKKNQEQMGKLVHNCYGMWGTSGSPLWSISGQLIGIHNSWNDKGHNISMIVHDSDEQQSQQQQKFECRVIRQYQRRAISIHVLSNLFLKWKQRVSNNSKQNQKSQNKFDMSKNGSMQQFGETQRDNHTLV